MEDYLIQIEHQSITRQMEDLRVRLNKLQEDCQHNSKKVGLYSWRIGSADEAYICECCGKMLGYVNNPNNWMVIDFKQP